MSRPAREIEELRRRARALNEAREYPALADLLDDLGDGELDEHPDLAFLRADVWRRVGRSEDALELLRATEPVFERRGNDRLSRRYLNLLGSLLFETGRVGAAADAWSRQLELAAASGDEEFVARANNNLGVAATLRDDLPAALSAYGRAVVAYQRLGYLRGLGQSHHNLGITFREMGFPREADHHFRKARQLARDADSRDEVARVDQERALLIYLTGDPDGGEAMARRSLEQYRELDDLLGQGEVHHVLGLIALGEGRPGPCEEALDRALALADEASAPLLRAEALEARAALRGVRGRPAQERRDREGASEIFGRIGAAAWGLRIRDRARSLAARGTASEEVSGL